MKIGIDISQIVYQTGVSRYTAELVRNLLKIDHINEYFLYAGTLRQRRVITDFINSLNSSQISSKITYLSPKFINLVWNHLNIFTPQTDLAVFHASNWALPKIKAKLVTTIHDLTFIKYPKTHTKYLVSVHKRHLNRAKKYADRIIAVSQSTKKDLVDYGIPETKIKVIYEAASPIFKPVNPAIVKKKYGLKSYFLSVGTLEPRKNISRLIQAYLAFKTNIQLVIIGKFGWGETYQNQAGIKFIGFVPDEDLVGLYSGAKAFIYPSLSEGFGLPVLEAMACGCPVITSNTSSLPEVGGNAAIYVNPNNLQEIAEALRSVGKLNLKQKSLQQAKKFSWEKTARETLTVYQEVAQC